MGCQVFDKTRAPSTSYHGMHMRANGMMSLLSNEAVLLENSVL